MNKKELEEAEKCKRSFAYFFEHYCAIYTQEGVRKPNQFEIQRAYDMENALNTSNVVIFKRRKNEY